ncbi:dual specificity protein phosphatase 22-B-like isoform X2 [Xenia sp. Carnegie-2017]|uniref:dual specificity protein phosphatase 22-B-like isoform X2 n=1 Tax=Xenia sp. Carnegie-2017 TaxID=2897299 RepID=UPI001F03A81B|nr:dual specificity protein phosphatase 22-B-like isoform X2 [Xenia sp. Carnegie-2017]XP_046842284.1 dual specificity protein phosphatase 22-B-like isoform X2 [Xenia sp. Carnegie-2017]XP_046842285.1 dual specificity protein phosphatase 22-B-like isoform X2 [Xenia sp. Carnegie-2017]XP_046842286.1 dual specificity protein phosphatase 22-B-like isoform X2 [Xenia sp. Carnegie-2017]
MAWIRSYLVYTLEIIKGYEYHCISVADFPGQDLTPYFEASTLFIHKARCEGGNVLVHCWAGISRSTTLTIAYIMAVTNMNWTEILKGIKCKRAIVEPNPGFKRQLNEFGKSSELIALKRKLKHDFKVGSFDDENYLQQVIQTTAEQEPNRYQMYDEAITVAAKYCDSSSDS